MKLEEGMFIRTPVGIDKITDNLGCYFSTKSPSVLRWNYDTQVNYFSIDGECFDKEEIKASHNIIDLIEVGDYVNGYKLLYQDSHYSYFDTDTCDWIYIKKDEQIKSIVTKEMFSNVEYRVETN